MRGKEEASEQRTEEVVAMAGAQRLLPTAVAPAPAQSQLAKEKQGWWGGALGPDIMCLESGGDGAGGGLVLGMGDGSSTGVPLSHLHAPRFPELCAAQERAPRCASLMS